MVGNFEHNGVRAAVTLGPRANLVSIDKPRPVASAARTMANSLDETATVLARWASAASPR